MTAHTDDVLTDAIRAGRVPGLSAAVVADGALQWSGAAGVLDARGTTPCTSETAYLWFSMTKIATATAAMRLVEHGRLSLDAEVDALVPGVLPKSATPVQVRHLLQHSAGIPNPPPVRWVRPASAAPPDPNAFLRARFAHVRRLRFEPGSRSSYTNLGYLLLGAVLEQADGRPFAEIVEQEVLEPLGMHATSFHVADGGMATGHQRLPRAEPVHCCASRSLRTSSTAGSVASSPSSRSSSTASPTAGWSDR